MVLPLDKKLLLKEDSKCDKEEKIPALHPYWKDNVNFVTYRPLPLGIYSGAVFEEWCERLRFITDDLTWLLKLPHYKFWCQVIFDDTLQACLDSFLKFAPRHCDETLPDDVVDRVQVVSRLVFMVYVRMATHKESKESFITPGVFGDIIYENFLFDIPKLMDLCALYHHSNDQLVSKMVQNIFTQQPKYDDDLHHSVQTVLTIFDNIEQKCNVKSNSGTMSPQKLSDPTKDVSTMSESDLSDIVLYVADSGATILSFLEAYPPACKAYHSSAFCVRIAVLHDGIVPLLKDALKERKFTSDSGQRRLWYHMRRAETGLVQLFRHVLNICCVQPVIEQSERANDFIEDFLSVMSSVLGERRFLAKYQSMFPFEDDRSILTQSQYEIDAARLQFIEDGVLDAFSTYNTLKPTISAQSNQSSPNNQPSTSARSADIADRDVQSVSDGQNVDIYSGLEGAAASSAKVSDVELDSLISSVKDLLPDIGEGFIEMCLEHTNYKTEEVINMILEGNYPEILQDVDRSLPRERTCKEDTSLVSQRANIYDHDAFDVFSHSDIDMSRVIQGKKEKTSQQTLDDKSDRAQLAPLYDMYQLVDAISYHDGAMYDDEYDDTYDGHEVGADDADSADELTLRRPFTIPRALGGVPQIDDDEEANSDETSSDSSPPKPVGVTTSQSADQQRSVRNREQRHVVNEQKVKATQKYDVKGKPKGKGQEANVLKNRDFKEKHKSSRANHNRKNMADRKRMKGMIPS